MTLTEYENLLERGPRLFGVPAIPLLALVAANLIPLVGVFHFGWDLRGIMLVYWAENVVVGIWAVIRMLWIGGPAALGIAIFFCAHYGVFTGVHLLFVYALADAAHWGGNAAGHGGAASIGDFFSQLSWWTVGALFVSHGISFYLNFIRKGEWASSSVQTEMTRPYPRMMVMHIAIIAGAFVIALADQPMALLAVLVLLKIAFDATAHVIEHRQAQHRVQAA